MKLKINQLLYDGNYYENQLAMTEYKPRQNFKFFLTGEHSSDEFDLEEIRNNLEQADNKLIIINDDTEEQTVIQLTALDFCVYETDNNALNFVITI